MENSDPVILEISSDEESGFGETRGAGGYGGGGEDHDWLSELLFQVDRVTDDSDDVVLVDEVIVKPKKTRLNSSNSSARSVNSKVDDDDDECVILDDDPDKRLAVENSKFDDEDSDDLVVVGEKGQVACRDFPHPRHLCAKFPFATTSHETHCDRCHCYVCDSLAPCVHWGSSISSMDHCHATDKEEFWITQRKTTRGKNQTPPVPNSIHNTFSIGIPQTAQISSLAPVQANSLPHNQKFSSVTVRPPIHFRMPNIMNRGRRPPSRSVVSRYKYQPHFVPQQLRSPQIRNVNPRDRRPNVGSGGSQFTPCTGFQKSGSVQGDSVNGRGYGLSRNSYASRFSRNLPVPRWDAFNGHPNSSASGYANYSHTEPRPSSQPPRTRQVTNVITSQGISSQPYSDGNFVNTIPSQPQFAYQPYVGDLFESITVPQHLPAFKTNGGNTFQPVTSQNLASSEHYTNTSFESQLHSESPMSSQRNMDGTYACDVSQSQLYNGPASLNENQIMVQQDNQIQNDIATSSTDFGYSWAASESKSNQQIPAGSSTLQDQVSVADNFLCQSVATENNSHFQSVPLENNSYHHIASPTEDFSLIDDIDSRISGSTDSNSFDFAFDNWLFENQSVPGGLEASVPAGFNICSPEPATIDAGTLFQF